MSVAGAVARPLGGSLQEFRADPSSLDYAHTAFIVREGSGARLLHASSKVGRVILDDRIGAYLARAPRSSIGITVLRPKSLRGR